MKKYIFGFDTANPDACARSLREKGYDAVVVGGADERTREALAKYGIDLYLCYGALGLRDEKDSLAVDVFGHERKWFGSGCPNNEALAIDHMTRALERVTDDVRGVFVDGARFASFASVEGSEGFFTCFCPRCTAKMEENGLDPEALRRAVQALSKGGALSPEIMRELIGWFAFREKCVQEYFDRFAEALHGLRSDLVAGAFVFAPTLCGYVGQTAKACRSLDVVAPMLYRAYPHPDGPACLGHEWAALKRLLGGNALTVSLCGAGPCSVPDETPEELLEAGFLLDRIALEVALAKGALRPGQRLLPILQIEDELRSETARLSVENGADGVGYFM